MTQDSLRIILYPNLARAVAPGGHVHTYEFHQDRAGECCSPTPTLSLYASAPYPPYPPPSDEARRELLLHGLGPDVVTVTHRDIMANGFPLDAHEGKVDAVFLDLPGPWKVVANAAKCLKPNGRWAEGGKGTKEEVG